MKMIIREFERGYLFQHGLFKRLLPPGQHRIFRIMGEEVQKVKAEGELKDIPGLKLMMKKQDFADCVVSVDIPDNHIALHYVDGKIKDALATGEYFFWNISEKHTFQLIDISDPEMKHVSIDVLQHIGVKHFCKIEVNEGECALLYFDSSFQRVLERGIYYFWNNGVKISSQKIDLRIQQLEVPGQEILTADKVGVRLNFVCTYRITDPVQVASQIKDFSSQLYAMVQLAIRRHVGTFRLDELLAQKNDIADNVLEHLRSQQERLFVEFHEAGLKDLILPGEIRDIMNTVLVAEKSAQANVISRREEVASTRSLLNTAKLLDENETLRRLKELEYLERICDKVGNISVSNGGNMLAQLQELITVKS